jgi:hypothetical protein
MFRARNLAVATEFLESFSLIQYYLAYVRLDGDAWKMASKLALHEMFQVLWGQDVYDHLPSHLVRYLPSSDTSCF